jgi:hypothetical protein
MSRYTERRLLSPRSFLVDGLVWWPVTARAAERIGLHRNCSPAAIGLHRLRPEAVCPGIAPGRAVFTLDRERRHPSLPRQRQAEVHPDLGLPLGEGSTVKQTFHFEGRIDGSQPVGKMETVLETNLLGNTKNAAGKVLKIVTVSKEMTSKAMKPLAEKN